MERHAATSLTHRIPMRGLSRIAQLFVLRCALACALLAGAGACLAQAPAAAGLERQVKAAYLYKFASFVEWPEASFARPDSELHIGVAGSAALAEQLEQMVAGRSVNGHPLRVRRVQAGEALGDLHILFLDSSLERATLAAMLGAARGHSLLTVSDAGEAMAMGCMIGFVVAEDKLRFDVALRSVTPSRLRISARMLAVAHRVQAAT
jgi:hypothetical protein